MDSSPHDDGFTLVELLVAMLVLLVGMLGVAQLVVTADGSTSRSLKREAATTLARDVIERSRQIPYTSLTGGAAGDALRAELGDGAAATRRSAVAFAVIRRGVAFEVAVETCRTDHGSDGAGVHDVSYCDFADPPPAGAPAPTGPDLALGLKLGGVYLKAAAGGGVLDKVCALVGAEPLGRVPGLDALLGRANGGLALVASGATVQLCPSGERVALDLTPDDLTQVVVTLRWTEGGRARELTQSTLIPNPGGAG